ncbi:MAG: hypothetical protein JXQ29_01265 [Planctomycetes bacterium]|nr:hypothetical protein [Planctomycetota bacterium]
MIVANSRRPVLLLAAALAVTALAGCPSVDPGSLDPERVSGRPGCLFRASCHFAGPAGGNPLALQDRVRQHFEDHLVTAYRLFERDSVLTATKTVINHPGLLRTLEINRFLSAFVLACAEDRWLTFYRKEDLLGAEVLHDAARRVLDTGGRLEIAIGAQALDVHEDRTPQILTFIGPALRIPLEKVTLGFRPESSRVTLTVRDATLLAELREKVDWREEDDPSLVSLESFAEKISLERTLYAVVAGIVLIEDVVRPGAQVILDDQGASWVFGGFLREAHLRWARSLFERGGQRTVERMVFEVRSVDREEPSGAAE